MVLPSGLINMLRKLSDLNFVEHIEQRGEQPWHGQKRVGLLS